MESQGELIDVLARIQISGTMPTKDFPGHILYCSQKSETNDNRTGARCISDIFQAARLVVEKDGSLYLGSEKANENLDVGQEPGEVQAAKVTVEDSPVETRDLGPKQLDVPLSLTPQIALNIQLHIPRLMIQKSMTLCFLQ